jgi:signal transduction histidine kinase
LQREHFERIKRNTKRLGRLASEILDVTKIDDQSLRLSKEYFNLKEIVLDLIQDHKRQLEKSNASTKLLYEFKIEEQEEIPTRQDDFSADIFINADKIRINQVLDNLLTNAIKFTEEGTVSISISCKKGKNHMDRIIVSVRDTGTGIHPEILKIVLKICYPKRHGYGFGIIHFKEYCRSSWWGDMGRE